MDFANPISIKGGKFKIIKVVKAYISAKICFAYKAVHLYVTGNLTTESFLNVSNVLFQDQGTRETTSRFNGIHLLMQFVCNSELEYIQEFLLNTVKGNDFYNYPCNDSYQKIIQKEIKFITKKINGVVV